MPIPDAEKIRRFDAALKVMYDLSYQAPEVRPANSITVERLGGILANGCDPFGRYLDPSPNATPTAD